MLGELRDPACCGHRVWELSLCLLSMSMIALLTLDLWCAWRWKQVWCFDGVLGKGSRTNVFFFFFLVTGLSYSWKSQSSPRRSHSVITQPVFFVILVLLARPQWPLGLLPIVGVSRWGQSGAGVVGAAREAIAGPFGSLRESSGFHVGVIEHPWGRMGNFWQRLHNCEVSVEVRGRRKVSEWPLQAPSPEASSPGRATGPRSVLSLAWPFWVPLSRKN